MGFFEKTVGDGFFQNVEIMFGTELNIVSLFIPLTPSLSAHSAEVALAT